MNTIAENTHEKRESEQDDECCAASSSDESHLSDELYEEILIEEREAKFILVSGKVR